VTSLPIQLTCNVTGVAVWRVNGTSYDFINKMLKGHSSKGTNILINSTVNNTEYICVSSTNFSVVISHPAYIIIAGEYICILSVTYLRLLHYVHTYVQYNGDH